MTTPAERVVKYDNDLLKEQRAKVRELVALLKSLDKDLQTLVAYNQHDDNFSMVFNDAELDAAQRLNAAKEALAAWAEIERIVGSNPALTLGNGQ